tara:strand:+ start:12315 stop:14567 length:2253 start_codon:yes stop_codon:yes gene_type:complete
MDALKKLPIWVVWKKQAIAKTAKQLNQRFTKVPYQINGQPASSVDPTQWSTFEEASNAAKDFSGIGFTISKHNPLLCIDLDHVVDAEGNVNRDDFHILIEAADTYTELSPSGDGLHLIFELDSHMPLIKNKKSNEDGTAFECYTDGRYFTFTGKDFGTPKPVRKISHEEADEILRMVGYPWGESKVAKPKIDATTMSLSLDDNVILEKMFKSKNGNDIEALYKGDISKYHDDASAADSALVVTLAFWTQKKAEQMTRIWTSSPLGQREKTKTRPDYVNRTVKNAIETCEKVYSPAPLIQENATATPDLEKEIRYSTNNKGVPFVNAHNVEMIIDSDTTLNKAFRYNEFSHEHESNVRTGREFTPLQKDDIIFTMAYIQKTYSFFEKLPQQTIQESIILAALKCVVNPPVDLIKSVQWDGESRINTWLTEVFSVEDNEVHRAIASNFLKGLVNRICSPGCKFDTVMVLEGAQGIKKSTALRILGEPWYAETTMDIDTKDFQLILTQNIIVEFSEGASLSRSASAAMKQKITDQEDNFRKPYDRTSQKYPRHCVFAMTTNEDQYLKDNTGNRRWLPVALPDLPANTEWLKENRQQMFAEAYHRVYVDKETTYEFPAEIENMQADRLEEDPWIGKISRWFFDILTPEQKSEGVTATDAYEQGVHKGEGHRDIRPGEAHRISSILKNHLALEKRRTMVNTTRSYRYFDTEETKHIEVEREKDLTPSEHAEKNLQKVFGKERTPDGRYLPQSERF